MSFLNKLKNYALGSGVELAMAIIYVLVGYMIIRIIINLLKRSVNRSKIEKTIPNFIISIFHQKILLCGSTIHPGKIAYLHDPLPLIR